MNNDSRSEWIEENFTFLVNGFENLKNGALILIIGFIIVWIIVLPAMVAIHSVTHIYRSGSGIEVIGAPWFIGPGIITAILSVVGVLMFKEGGANLKRVEPYVLDYGESGPKYMLYGLIMTVVGMLGVLARTAAVLSLILVFLGAIMSLVGGILFGIFLLRLEELRRRGVPIDDFKADGILWIIGLFIPVLTIIAVILIYVHARGTLERLYTLRQNT